MSGRQGAASPSGIGAKIGVALLALAPPALVGAGFWAEVRGSPLVSAVALAGYLLLLVGLRFAGRVGGAVSDKWVPRAAEAVDRVISAVLLGYRTRYLIGLSRSVRDIELLGVATRGGYTLRLREVYVELSVLPQALHETAREPFVGTLVGSAERRTLGSFLGDIEPGVFAVIGGPGSGKTTLLRRTALDLCRRGFRTRPLPVLLPLRDHVEAIVRAPEPTLGTVAASVSWMAGKLPADWLEQRLDRGRCLVLLDGLDEVAAEGDRRTVVAWVRRQTARYPNNDYVLTSRPHGYLANPLSNADILVVRRFTGEQISRFIQEWYYAIECRETGESGAEIRARSRTKADGLLRRLRSQSRLYDLAANPLLLTMIANVHRYRGVPSTSTSTATSQRSPPLKRSWLIGA